MLAVLDSPGVDERRPGRPRMAPATTTFTLTLPLDVFDLCCREAHARGVPLAAVMREAIITSRRQRGELR
jgi:hypothetical protein